jgi:hypothetical protein
MCDGNSSWDTSERVLLCGTGLEGDADPSVCNDCGDLKRSGGLGEKGIKSCLSGEDLSQDTTGLLYGDGDTDSSVRGDLVYCGDLGKEGVDSCLGNLSGEDGGDGGLSRDTAEIVDLLYGTGLEGVRGDCGDVCVLVGPVKEGVDSCLDNLSGERDDN